MANVGTSYKVPFGEELPFAGRWLTCTRILPGAVEFKTSTGKLVCLGRASAECLSLTADATR